MAKETASSIFKDLVNSPIGIIAEFIVNTIAFDNGYKPLRDFILQVQTGKTPPMNNREYYSSNDVEWIKPSDIGFKKYINASDWISNTALKEKKATIYKPNTILIICIGGGIGRLGIVDKMCSSNQQITGILMKDNVLAEYAYYFFLSRYKIFEANSSKTTLPIINQKGLGNLDFVCPDLKIQEEIVRFLNYYKECLDNNSYPVNDGFNLDNKILDFAIRAFKASIIQQSLIKENKTQSNLLSKLRQAYLQEAVMGKLTEPSQDNAQTLLKAIKSQKAELIKQGKLRKEKPLAPIKPEEIPFEIPDNWVWCRLGEICDTITKGSSPKWQGVQYVDSAEKGILFITSKNVDSFTIDLSNVTYVEAKFNEIEPRSVLKKGDLLTNIVGASIGRTALYDLDIIANINQAVCILRIEHEFINKSYLLNLLNSSFVINQMFESQFAPGRANLSMGDIATFPIPLPPLSEQKAIVAKVEGLLGNISLLESENKAQQIDVQRLMGAVLQEAFGGR